MNDDTTAATTASPLQPPAVTTPPPAEEKNPLDVLEELLKDSSKGEGAPEQKTIPGDTTLSPEELEKKRAEYEQKQQEQQVLDQQAVAEQQQLLQSIKETDQYKARVVQDAQRAEEIKEQAAASDGFEIVQLDHDKV